MKEQQVKIYRCDFCKKKGFRKHLIIRHELFCSNNPVNRVACTGCKHLENTDIEIFLDGWGEKPDSARKFFGFKCQCTGQLMYNAKAIEKDLIRRYPETFQEQVPMPKTCSMAEYYTYGDDNATVVNF